LSELGTFRGWCREGTGRLAAVVDGLDDAAFAAPSALPDWTRAHVVGHLARNAEALHRLTMWAATGVENPMYPDLETRAADIESSAVLDPAVLRAQCRDTADALEEAMDGLDDASWQATVRSALGRVMPATQIPWMRTREVWLHAVDLGTGVEISSFPDDVIDALLADLAGVVGAKPATPPLLLRLTDRDREFRLGPAETSDPQVVEVTAAQALGWISGRAPGQYPALPAWI
jgi:maleylpyruvate isomerase